MVPSSLTIPVFFSFRETINACFLYIELFGEQVIRDTGFQILALKEKSADAIEVTRAKKSRSFLEHQTSPAGNFLIVWKSFLNYLSS